MWAAPEGEVGKEKGSSRESPEKSIVLGHLDFCLVRLI